MVLCLTCLLSGLWLGVFLFFRVPGLITHHGYRQARDPWIFFVLICVSLVLTAQSLTRAVSRVCRSRLQPSGRNHVWFLPPRQPSRFVFAFAAPFEHVVLNATISFPHDQPKRRMWRVLYRDNQRGSCPLYVFVTVWGLYPQTKTTSAGSLPRLLSGIV